MSANDVQIGGDHYKNMAVEPWDVVDSWPVEQRIGYYRGCALKYVMRMGSKDENVQEIKKAIHYLQKLTEVLPSSEWPFPEPQKPAGSNLSQTWAKLADLEGNQFEQWCTAKLNQAA